MKMNPPLPPCYWQQEQALEAGHRFLPHDAGEWTTSTIIMPTPLGLFEKVMVPSVRKKVYYQRQQIRAGVVTPEEAGALIPRFDLRLAAVKEEYRACVIS
ncbi:predicted protein [Histoplasma capsulatum G186AR]|uniref:Uncharacterized protein n=1 Tax=Ajellomyces capsulatus (strain G186AR / H82 / ATCC MYA-2454 / RMSCC 2432) TaxID=447093 RepID=C0NBB7_AJECG|nr:uncharacterized protein HCBG_00413 [Histoplasma capsulatum G186AR]EEH10958.1 predicted protein [Histoplasma capsulatum G186AR]